MHSSPFHWIWLMWPEEVRRKLSSPWTSHTQLHTLISSKSFCNIYGLFFSWADSCHMTLMWHLYPLCDSLQCWCVNERKPKQSHSMSDVRDVIFSAHFVEITMSICQADGKSGPCDQTAASAFLPYFPTNWIFSPATHCHSLFLCPTATSHRGEDAWLMCISNVDDQEILTQSRCGSGPLHKSCDSLQTRKNNIMRSSLPFTGKADNSITVHTDWIWVDLLRLYDGNKYKRTTNKVVMLLLTPANTQKEPVTLEETEVMQHFTVVIRRFIQMCHTLRH